MPTADSGGVPIEYDTYGDPDDPALMLIMGFTGQMTAWDLAFCRMLVDQRFFVIRFDNRDCGLSGKTEGDPPNLLSILMAVMAGQDITDEVPYTLSDMAGDAVAVLDDVEVAAAHVVGASMGGMISQQMAIDHPDRVLSLTSIMSTTGNPEVGQGSQQAMAALMTPPPADREAYVERSVEVGRIISGPLYDEALARVRIGQAYDRSFYPRGGAFQLAAIAKTGDRTVGLQSLDVPTLVIHGEVDPLVALSGGEATAAAVPGAKLLVFDDMGHDLPRPLWPEISSAIAELAARAA